MNTYPWLEQYLLKKCGTDADYQAEWGWRRFLVGGKMYAALLHPSDKYNPAYAGKDLLNVKCDPRLAELLRKEYPQVLPAFYMDKRCWNSVNLDGSLPEDVLRTMLDDSYQLVFEKLTKKLQKEILAGAIPKTNTETGDER